MKRWVVTLVAASGAMMAPICAAQEANAPASPEAVDTLAEADELALIEQLFPDAEPLTQEQQARMPQARLVVDKIFPAGTYAKMMKDQFKPMMNGLMGQMLDTVQIGDLSDLTGLYFDDLEAIDESKQTDAMAILDPARRERLAAINDLVIEGVTQTINRVEPAYRDGLVQAYAARFSAVELADISAFFATPTGGHYAAQSLLIYSDPQVMAATKKVLPEMMAMGLAITEQAAAQTGKFSQPRKFSDLSSVEQKKLAEILGVTTQKLAEAEPSEEDYSWDEVEEGSE